MTDPATVDPAASQQPYRVFALKYRPQVFADVVGQQTVVRQLQGEIVDNRVGHAYLFTGPRGVGKTSMARIFAKALNCVNGPTPSPCGKCTHCLGITNDADLDVVEVDAATYTKKEETVEMLEGVDRAAFHARYKVYIIDEVHMFSSHSFNVLLKRLEEPPPGVVFILATTNPEKIPETVISRCRRLEFDRMDSGDIVGRLREICDKEKVKFVGDDRERILEAIALASEGGMRDSQVALDQLISLSEGEVSMEYARQLLGIVENDLLVQLLRCIVERKTVEALMLVQALVDKGRDLQRFVKTFTTFLRDGMVLKANAPDELLKVSRSNAAALREVLKPVSMPALLNMVQQFLTLEERMRGAAPARFLLEFTLMKLTAIQPAFVLDAMDPTALRRTRVESPEGGGGSPGRGSAEPAPTTPARVVPVREESQQDHAPRAALMHDSAVALMDAPGDVEVGEESPWADSVNEAPPRMTEEAPFQPTPEQKNQFRARLADAFAWAGSTMRDAEVSFPNEYQVGVAIPWRDRVMLPMLQRPEHEMRVRDVAKQVFGRALRMVLSVGEAPTGDLPEPAEEETHEPVVQAPMAREAVAPWEDPAPTPAPRMATPEPPALGAAGRELNLKQAMDSFPDLKETITLVKKHCGADPFLFNGHRVG